jgi:DNA-binding transcriptional regulator YiaG
MTDIPELTTAQFERAMPASVRRRLVAGHIESGADIIALRNFLGLTQERFASAVGISVHTLRNWEQGRRRPDGPAVALLRIAARHPRVILENVRSAAESARPGDFDRFTSHPSHTVAIPTGWALSSGSGVPEE